MNILDKIVAAKKLEVEACKARVPFSELENTASFARVPVSLRERLLRQDSTGIIAEFKRKSPSKGVINDRFSPSVITGAYQDAGAAAVSVLTDEAFFGGIPADLIAAREVIHIPVLRKEFIIDEYQIVKAKSLGADLILLIAAILEAKQVKAYATLARSLGMEILFEVHDLEELNKMCPEVTLVGVNNRNLKNFVVDIRQSLELSEHIPDDFIKVSESGISRVESILQLKEAGYKGFLMGENFMKADDPGIACRSFISELLKK